jgi:hypothetical protein
VGKREGKGLLVRPKRRWVDNIKMDIWCSVDWSDLAQDRDQWRDLVNTVLTFRFHKLLRVSRIAAQLAASQEGLSFM